MRKSEKSVSWSFGKLFEQHRDLEGHPVRTCTSSFEILPKHVACKKGRDEASLLQWERIHRDVQKRWVVPPPGKNGGSRKARLGSVGRQSPGMKFEWSATSVKNRRQKKNFAARVLRWAGWQWEAFGSFSAVQGPPLFLLKARSEVTQGEATLAWLLTRQMVVEYHTDRISYTRILTTKFNKNPEQ